MVFDYTGARALVTGAGHGIGRGIALALARSGADVAVHYASSADAAADTVAEISGLGRTSVSVQADLTRTDQVESMVDQVVSALGGLDVVVCNAGHLVGRAPVEQMTDEHYLSVVEVNLGSTFRTCRAVIPHLRRSDRARIVTMASLAAHNGGGAGAVLYASSKAAIRGFTKGLAKELGLDRITVNAVAPGYIAETAFHATFSTPQAQQKMVDSTPVGRAGQVEDVAAAVLYLASAEAGYITGTTLDIDGGTYPR